MTQINPAIPAVGDLNWGGPLINAMNTIVTDINSIDNRVGTLESSSSNGVGSAVEVVLPAPSGDTTGSSDTSALQSAINASPVNSTVRFRSGIYYLNAPLILPDHRAYVGSGYGYGVSGSTVKQADRVNLTNTAGLTGLLVPAGWASNATTVDYPISIRNLTIDGNWTNNTTSTACGIILYNFWSLIEGVQIVNMPKHGIHLTDVTANGTNTATNSASENRLHANRIDTVGGNGINQNSTNGQSHLDGFCTENIIANPAGDGISFTRAAGWIFRRNHLYSIKGNGIKASNAFSTTITETYLEDFGGANVAGTYYVGIQVSVLNLWGVHVTNNFVSCLEIATNAVGAYQYIAIDGGNSQTDAHAIVTGNMVHGPASPGSKGIGLLLDTNGGGGVLFLRHRDNRIANVNTRTVMASAVTVLEEDSQGVEHPITNAATTSYGGAARGSGASLPVLTGNDFSGKITFATGTSPAAGVLGGVSFERNFASAPSVVLTAGNAATAALQLYATPGVGSCDIGCGVAPAASQVAGTYVVYYRVIG